MCLCKGRWKKLVCFYVDDIIIIDNNENIKTTKKMLSPNFDMKDLGVVDVILGMKISKVLDEYTLSITHFIN